MKKLLLIGILCTAQVYHSRLYAFNIKNLWQKTEQETMTKEYQIESRSIINVFNTEGSVTIKPWNQHKVTIEVSKRGSAEALKATTISSALNASGSIATITTRVPENKQSATVDFTIMVPEDATLKIMQTKGPVRIRGVLGSIDVSLEEGNITIIDATKMVSAKTGSGTISLDQKKLDDASGIFLESHKGSITLRLPKETRAHLHARTIAGVIVSDHPVTLVPITLKINREGWKRLQKEVEGTLGGLKGGAPITLEATKGNITIKEY